MTIPIVIAISCLVTWLIIGINAYAQDRLLIAKMGPAVRLTWHDSNVTAVVVATNLGGSAKPLLYRTDTNPTSYVITIIVPVEKQSELFSTAPKFIGMIPEVRR